MWFETLTGFHEQSPEQVRNNISVNGEVMKSYVNGKEFVYGTLETPSLAELRNRVHSSEIHAEELSVREVIANVQHLHASESNAGSLFQVASQFNLLEMVSPDVTPEHGVGGYEYLRIDSRWATIKSATLSRQNILYAVISDALCKNGVVTDAGTCSNAV